MTISTANLKPLPEPLLQAHLHRVYDSHDEYRGTDARYLDGVHRREPRRKPLGFIFLALLLAPAGVLLWAFVKWVVK